MNQTVTINISGIVFHIEVGAYDQLKSYLNKIKSYFKNSEECDEIMTDIEARIAELFSSKLTPSNQVINEKDVEEVMSIMGKPEQYVDEEEGENQTNEKPPYTNYSTAKKLFRDPDERIIGGVASGIASYFGIDSILVRLFFVIMFFIGFGPLFYLILWIVIPEAKTASDKLKMKGDDVNIDNIGKTIKYEANKMSEQLTGEKTTRYVKKAGTAVEAFFSFLTQLLRGFFNVFGKILGVLLIIVGTFWLVGLIGMLIGSDAIFSITSDGVFSIESTDFFNLIFVSENQFHLALVGILMAIGVPIITFIYAGVKLLFKVKTHYSINLVLLIFWIIGLSICGMVGIKMGTELSQDNSISTTKNITIDNNQINIKAIVNEFPGKGILEDNYSIISLDKDSIYLNDINVNILKSKTDSIQIVIKKSSNGKSIKDAFNNSNLISYTYSVTDNTIELNNYLSTLKENKFRGQGVEIEIYIPIGKSIYLDKSLKRIIYDIENVTNTYDHKMLNKNWVMLEEGLTCLDCDNIEGITTLQLDSINSIKPIVEEVIKE
jgi:phage shock protein PspC (stress-responsive transcriptional regulator)